MSYINVYRCQKQYSSTTYNVCSFSNATGNIFSYSNAIDNRNSFSKAVLSLLFCYYYHIFIAAENKYSLMFNTDDDYYFLLGECLFVVNIRA